MDIGINSVKDLVELVGIIAAASAVIWASLSYRLSNRQFMSSIMISCVERYHGILEKFASNNDSDRQLAARLYVDLCNEELFYMENRYLPDPVIDEWLAGMALHLPFFDIRENSVQEAATPDVSEPNSFGIPRIVFKERISGYPRIEKAFQGCTAVTRDRTPEIVTRVRSNLGIPSKFV